MLERLDSQERLTGNQIRLITAATFGVALEFLDYFLIGFVLVFVVGPWSLTVWQSSTILLASGVGAMIGAAYFGWLADRIGRRKVFMVTIGIFSIGTAALAATPDSASFGWLYLSGFRFLIGFGAGGLYCVDLPLVQEFTPTQKRGVVTGLVTAAVPVGFLLGSLMVYFLAPSIGWRGLMVICTLMAGITLFIRTWIPESPRWLLRQGRPEEARAAVAWALDVPAETLPVSVETRKEQPPSVGEIAKYPRSWAVSWLTNLGAQTGYYGLALWSPVILVQLLGVKPSQAAFYMIFITLAAFVGRFLVSFLSESIGRRATGTLCSLSACAVLVAAALMGDALSGAAVLLIGLLMIAYFFGEGGFAVVGPYSAEVWPSRLRAMGMGSAYGFGGLGKIIGPMGLALIAGGSAAPGAGVISAQGAFTYFAAWYALAGLAFLFFGFETRGRSLEALDDQLAGEVTALRAESTV